MKTHWWPGLRLQAFCFPPGLQVSSFPRLTDCDEVAYALRGPQLRVDCAEPAARRHGNVRSQRPDAVHRRGPPARPCRVCHGDSVIAGVSLSMIVYLVISALVAAIGAPLLAPLSKPHPLQGFGLGSGVWIIVTTVLTVFIGPYPPSNRLRCRGLRETVVRVLAADASVHITGFGAFCAGSHIGLRRAGFRPSGAFDEAAMAGRLERRTLSRTIAT